MIRQANNRHGFTIIEVSIFLAMTALIFVGMIVGVNTALRQNHYDEDVRGISEFIQGVYSKVTSVENDYSGTSNKAIYGKLITFGESLDLSLANNTEKDVFIYDIVGDISNTNVGGTKAALEQLNADVIVKKGATTEYAGIADFYRSRWGTKLKATKEKGGGDLKGAIMIVRSPSSGTIFTYVSATSTVEVNLNRKDKKTKSLTPEVLAKFYLSGYDICVENDMGVYGGKMKDVRISNGARSASGVNIMSLDGEGTLNKCN